MSQTYKALQVIVEKTHKNAVIPTKGSSEAACFDVYSVQRKAVKAGLVTIIRTGIQMRIPHGYMIQIVPRSGLAYRNGIAVLGGIIDSDYRGEIMVMLSTLDLHTTQHTVNVGDRIAQLQVIPVPQVEMIEGSVSDDTDRGTHGFGSTGL